MKTMLQVQVEKSELEKFKDKCEINKPYHIFIKEIITAFNEDRLRIIPTEDQNNLLKIYEKES